MTGQSAEQECFCIRPGASAGGVSEKRDRREGEQTGGDPEVHRPEQKREAAAGAGGVSTGAEFSGRCKSKS